MEKLIEGLRSFETPIFLHYFIGGPCDGMVIPSIRQYLGLEYEAHEGEIKRFRYDSRGEELQPCNPINCEVLNCTGTYTEYVYFRVNMRYNGRRN